MYGKVYLGASITVAYTDVQDFFVEQPDPRLTPGIRITFAPKSGEPVRFVFEPLFV